MHTHHKITKQPLSISLSHPQRINSGRLDLFGKGITYIDKLSQNEYINQIREIDLSHNAITKLDNI